MGGPHYPGRTGRVVKANACDASLLYVALEATARAQARTETFWISELEPIMEQTLSPYAELAIGTIAPSPTNPRKTFHDLEDLAASIREQGVMQPILARLWPEDYPTPEGRAERPLYEIIAGERRYRASLLAGLDTIPALVRVLNTRQVLEAQIVENLQRRDVTELEEAEGYQLMMRDHGYTADQLAEKVGKSRAYIYGRLKLCDMTEAPREAFRAGQIKASVALLIARIPTAELQARATACIVAADMSAREAARHLQENNYMLQLERATWPLEEAFADLPACVGCSFNSSTDREQYADISQNVCTNRECFGNKREAHLERAASQLIAHGHQVFTGDKARNLAPTGTDFYIHNGYVPVARSEWLQGRHQTVAQAYGELLANAPRTWIEDIRTGALVECVSREHLWQLDRQAAAAKLSPEEVAQEAAERDRKLHTEEEAKQREEMENTFRNELLARTQTIYRASQAVPDGALRALTRAAIRFEGIDDELAERYLPGVPHDDDDTLEAAMHAKLDEADGGQLLAILIDVMMPTVHRASRFLPGSLETPRELLELARVYGIDPDAVRGELGGSNADEDEPTAAPEETAPTPPQAPPGGDDSAKKPATGLAVAAEVSARLKLNAVPYRHPDNADLTWTGRGRKPAWVEAWLKDGGTLEDLSTPEEAAPAADTTAPKFEVGQRARIKAGACWENGAPIGSDNTLVVIRIPVADGYNVMFDDGSLRTYIPAYALEPWPSEDSAKPTPTPTQAAPATAKSPAKPKKEAATAAKKSKEKAKDSGRASPAGRKGKTTAAPTDDAPIERDTKTIDLIDAHFPELAGADQAQQEAAA